MEGLSAPYGVLCMSRMTGPKPGPDDASKLCRCPRLSYSHMGAYGDTIVVGWGK